MAFGGAKVKHYTSIDTRAGIHSQKPLDFILGIHDFCIKYFAQPFSRATIAEHRMPKLKKFKVDFISLLKEEEPANGKAVIYKSNDGADFKFDLHLTKLRKDAKLGYIYGTVYEPDVQDTQSDWADEEQITEAAELFLKEKRINMVDVDHNYMPGAGDVVQSFIKQGDDPRFPDSKNGSWCVVIKLADASKFDEIKGLSMAGGGVYDRSALPPKDKVEKGFGSPDPSNDPNNDNDTPTTVKPAQISATINTLIEQLQKFDAQISGEASDNGAQGKPSPKVKDTNDLSTTKSRGSEQSSTAIRPLKGDGHTKFRLNL